MVSWVTPLTAQIPPSSGIPYAANMICCIPMLHAFLIHFLHDRFVIIYFRLLLNEIQLVFRLKKIHLASKSALRVSLKSYIFVFWTKPIINGFYMGFTHLSPHNDWTMSCFIGFTDIRVLSLWKFHMILNVKCCTVMWFALDLLLQSDVCEPLNNRWTLMCTKFQSLICGPL